MMSNIATVQNVYAAFGRGDVPAILGVLDEDVDWEYGRVSSGVPWLEPRQGRASVAGFFEALTALEFQKFQPKTFLESGNIVVVLVDLAMTFKETGKTIAEEDEVHIWHFNGQGKVVRFCHKLDGFQHWRAIQCD